METDIQNQNAFEIEDMMRLMKIKCRATFYRKRKKKQVAEPDTNDGYPRWYRSSLLKTMPYLFVDESSQTTNS